MHRIRPKLKAFTLVELLMVITIIGILAALTFGIARGVTNARNRAKAKVELATISQAMEQFKSRYGDYPWLYSGSGFPGYQTEEDDSADEAHATNAMLTYALTGRLIHQAQDPDPSDPGADVEFRAVKVADSLEDPDVINNPIFIDITKFSTAGTGGGDEEYIPQFILDPWGNPYRYWYKLDNNKDDWDVFGFHLYSTGPDGKEAHDAIKAEIEDEDTGVLNDDFREVADAAGIIFAGE